MALNDFKVNVSMIMPSRTNIMTKQISNLVIFIVFLHPPLILYDSKILQYIIKTVKLVGLRFCFGEMIEHIF